MVSLRRQFLLLSTVLTFSVLPVPAASVVTWDEASVGGFIDATFTADPDVDPTWTKDYDFNATETVAAVDGAAMFATATDSKEETGGDDAGETIALITVEGQFSEGIENSDTAALTVDGTYDLAGYTTVRAVGTYSDIEITTNYVVTFSVSQSAILSGSVDLSWFDSAASADDVGDGMLDWVLYEFESITELNLVDSGAVSTSSTADYSLSFSDIALNSDTNYWFVMQYAFTGESFTVGNDSDNLTTVSYFPTMTANLTVVPEPATGALLTVALGGLLLRRGRRG